MAKQKDHEAKETKKPKHQATAKKVFDVAPPGKMPAAANSRSVPPSIKPPVPDDQLVPGAPKLRAHNPNEERPLLEHNKPVAITPPERSDDDQGDAAPETIPTAPVLTEERPSAAAPLPAAGVSESTPVPRVETAEEEPPEAAASPAPETPSATEEPTPGQLAVEQMVEADAETPGPQSPPSARSSKSIDDLLAESGAPVLDTEPPQGVLVSHHSARHSWLGAVFIFLAAVIIAAVVLNFLLDAEVITTDLDLPYTNLL